MKRIEKRATDGSIVTFLMPENEADVEELRRLEDAGIADNRHSFGDDPEVWGFSPDDAPPEEDL